MVALLGKESPHGHIGDGLKSQHLSVASRCILPESFLHPPKLDPPPMPEPIPDPPEAPAPLRSHEGWVKARRSPPASRSRAPYPDDVCGRGCESISSAHEPSAVIVPSQQCYFQASYRRVRRSVTALSESGDRTLVGQEVAQGHLLLLLFGSYSPRQYSRF
jgi:hypothetical protein